MRGDLAATLHGLGQDTEAAAIYSGLLSETGLEARDLFNFGIALYRTNDFVAAARGVRATDTTPAELARRVVQLHELPVRGRVVGVAGNCW